MERRPLVNGWTALGATACFAATIGAAAYAAPGSAPRHVQAAAPSAPAGATPQASKNDAEQAPTPDQLLERYVRALGGERALRKISSRLMKGKFEAPAAQLAGDAEILTAAPDKFYSRVTIPDSGEFISAFDGKAGWSSEPRGGLREMQGAELENMRRSSQFQHELRFREIFPQLRVLEKSTEEGRPVWVLEATPPGGTPEKFYFDAESGLLLRHDSVQLAPDSEVPIEHRYSEYAPVDGVQVPHLLRHKDPNVEWQVSFTEIRHNVAVDPARFSKPAAP
jgi:hypothetical protein